MVTTDYIFDEVMTVLLVGGNKDLAVQAGKAIIEDPNIEILRTDEALFSQAWELFQSSNNEEWSFTDCTSYRLMKGLNIGTGISFERHPKQLGVRVLP